ncbi:hypothetical protein FQA39_LY06753 [Lamprigera yunnana]|nr:hypothetical protein FQA39_LY06753 [Lamprigera yunnana]
MLVPKGPLQIEVNTNTEWKELLEKKELLGMSNELIKHFRIVNVLHFYIVVDVYSDWCGPCMSMLPTLSKIKQQVGGEITFAKANANNILTLEKFRNKSEPTWLLLAGGKIVNVVYGSNSPQLLNTISSQLKKEISFQKGENIENELEEKEEPIITKPTLSVKPEEGPPRSTNPEFSYQPFRVTYFK